MIEYNVYAGLDMHQEKTVATIKDEQGNSVRFLSVETSKEGMKKLFQGIKKNAVEAVFEASKNWFHYYTLLQPHCAKITMAHPTKIKAIASAKVKTDAIDSNTLCDLLRANLIPESYMPDVEIVELRNLIRHRAFLSKSRAMYKNKVKNILAREGKKSEFTDVFAHQARLWLNNLELTPLSRMEMNNFITNIDQLTQEIKELDEQIEKESHKYPETAILKSIAGISTFSAMLLIAEIGDFSRFANPNQLTSYVGLVPSTYQSSTTLHHGKITKQGSHWVRWILTQCAHASLATRRPHRLKNFYRRIHKRVGHSKAIVAVARKMLSISWHLIRKNELYAY